MVKDTRSKSVFAFAVPQKGIDQKRFAVDAFVESVLWFGYGRVILKSDNAPSIINLLQEAMRALKVKGIDQASEEHPPPYDPQANEAVEASVKQVQARLKTLKRCLERRIGKRIPHTHPITACVVAHCAVLIRY